MTEILKQVEILDILGDIFFFFLFRPQSKLSKIKMKN